MLIAKMLFCKCWTGKLDAQETCAFSSRFTHLTLPLCLPNFDRDLEEAEDQYQMALRTHLVNIDTLIKLHDSRLYALERNFQHELKVLQEDFFHEKENMLEKFNNEKMELKAIIEAIDQEEDGRNLEVKHRTQIVCTK